MRRKIVIAALQKVLADISPEAIKEVENYVENWSFSDAGKKILQYKDQYPKPDTNTLYRVVFLDKSEYENFLSKGLTPRNKHVESWSLTKRAVEAYAEDRAASLDEDWDHQYMVFLTKTIPTNDIVVDVTQLAKHFSTDNADNVDIEKEVITLPQKITKDNIHKVVLYDPKTGDKK